MSGTETRRLALPALIAIVLIAFALRLWRIDSLPPGFHFDESFEALEAWHIATDPGYRPIFLTGNFGVAPLNAYANAITFALFPLFGGEAGPAAMRTTAAIFGVLGVLAVFALGTELRHLDPQRLTAAFPLLAAALLATLRWHVHFSRIGIEPILVPLLWAAAAWLLLRGWRLQSWASFAGCGLVLALAMYSYQGAWIIPFLMIPVVGHLWWAERRTRRLAGPLLAAAVALLLILPLAWFFAGNPDLLILRPAQIVVTGDQPAAAASPVQNALASTLMFVPAGQTGDLDPRRNLPGEAALNWWQFAPFAAGAAIALWRLPNPAYSLLIVGLAGLLLPGVFSEYAPHFHRVLGAAAPAALLCGVGLDALVRLGLQQAQGRGRQWPAWLAAALAVAIILGGAIVGARDYFVRWAALPDLFYAFDTGLWQIGQEIARRPASEAIYLTPRPAGHPTLAFALAVAPAQRLAPISFDGRHVFPLTAGPNSQDETYFVVAHEDFRTPLLLPEVLPQATVTKTIVEPGGAVYANVYTRPAGALPGRTPQHAREVALDESISLAGYDVQPASLQAGEILYLQLHWLVNAAAGGDWTVFTHLLRRADDEGYVQVAGSDSQPGAGSLPTSRWQPGWRVLDEYQIALPGDLAPGTYLLAAGLYRADGARLPADGPGILLGDVVIE
jgi:4-amino-4-deoxy-L-arabinose transferase-like glycosyltransferase